MIPPFCWLWASSFRYSRAHCYKGDRFTNNRKYESQRCYAAYVRS